jgi:hypothetical protein
MTSRKFGYAGLENGKDCYCGNTLPKGRAPGTSGCGKPCAGNSVERCGGTSSLSLFRSTNFVFPSRPQSVSGYNYRGCFAEPRRGRVLYGPRYSDKSRMTIESCLSFCKQQSPPLKFAGVENKKTCICGDSINPRTSPQGPGKCNSLCTGNKLQFCGAAGYIDVYKMSNK